MVGWFVGGYVAWLFSSFVSFAVGTKDVSCNEPATNFGAWLNALLSRRYDTGYRAFAKVHRLDLNLQQISVVVTYILYIHIYLIS